MRFRKEGGLLKLTWSFKGLEMLLELSTGGKRSNGCLANELARTFLHFLQKTSSISLLLYVGDSIDDKLVISVDYSYTDVCLVMK